MSVDDVGKKKRKLKDITVDFVSLVKRPATGKSFFLWKSRDKQEDQTIEKHTAGLRFVKGEASNDVKRILYGVVYPPDETDLEGDFMSAELIERAAHDYMINHRNVDHEHDYVEGKGYVVESYIAMSDIKIEGADTIKKGSWVMAVKVTPEIWQEFEKGNLTGFSLAGKIFDSEFIRTPEEESKLDENRMFFWSVQSKEDLTKKQDDEVDMEELKKLQEVVDGLTKTVGELAEQKHITNEDLTKSIDEKVNVEDITKSINDGIKKTLEKAIADIETKFNEKVEELEKKLTDNQQPGESTNESGVTFVETSFSSEGK